LFSFWYNVTGHFFKDIRFKHNQAAIKTNTWTEYGAGGTDGASLQC